MKVVLVQPPPRHIAKDDIVVPPMQSRVRWVDYAKGMGIIMVVYGHITGGALGSTLIIPNLLYAAYKIIYHFHMPLFFFLSGLFVHQSLEKRGLSKFIIDKTHIILYPYFIWSIIQGVAVLIISSLVTLNATVSVSDLLSIPYKPLQHLWFLYSLFLMFLIYSVFAQYKYSSIIFIIFSVILFFFPVNTSNYAISQLCFNFIFFVLGVIYWRYSLDSLIDKKLSLFTVCMAVIVFVFFEFVTAAITLKPLLLLNAVAGITMTCFTAKYAAKNNFLKVLRNIGLYTMPIYLAQGIGSFARITLHNFWGVQNTVLVILISSLVGIVAPIIFYVLSDRLNFLYFFTIRREHNR